MTKSLYCNKIEKEKGKCRNRQQGFMMMPNHFHGILIIGADQPETHSRYEDVSTISGKSNPIGMVPPSERAPARGATTILGSIIGAFKSRCVNENLKYIEETGLNELGKFWQRNYYERIIRNNRELTKMRQYIRNNPIKWIEDGDNRRETGRF